LHKTFSFPRCLVLTTSLDKAKDIYSYRNSMQAPKFPTSS
jgi:hypothetical protein